MEHVIKSLNKAHQTWAAKNGTGTIRNVLNALIVGLLRLQELVCLSAIFVHHMIHRVFVLLAIKDMILIMGLVFCHRKKDLLISVVKPGTGLTKDAYNALTDGYLVQMEFVYRLMTFVRHMHLMVAVHHAIKGITSSKGLAFWHQIKDQVILVAKDGIGIIGNASNVQPDGSLVLMALVYP